MKLNAPIVSIVAGTWLAIGFGVPGDGLYFYNPTSSPVDMLSKDDLDSKLIGVDKMTTGSPGGTDGSKPTPQPVGDGSIPDYESGFKRFKENR